MKKRVVIVGAGPAGLIAAETLAQAGVAVEIFDRMAAPGRKFLMAGRGGLNLTHSEGFDAFLDRYGDAAAWLKPYIEAFPAAKVREWAAGLGIETFVGTSGRVFPKDMKATPMLRAQLRRLSDLGVKVYLNRTWLGWGPQGLLFDGGGTVSADAVLLALGGASWPRLGSNAAWLPFLLEKGVQIAPFRPANCGFSAEWSAPMAEFAGTPLKGIALKSGPHVSRGEAVITRDGIEGGGIYAISRFLRDDIEATGTAMLEIDLRPDMTAEQVGAKLKGGRRGASVTNRLRKGLHLSPAAVCLLREGYGVQLPADPAALAACVKSVPVRLKGTAGLARAISSAGGILLDEVDTGLMLKKLPGVFVAGEMLDWEAPTGGYLLTACFATGQAAAQGILQRFADIP